MIFTGREANIGRCIAVGAISGGCMTSSINEEECLSQETGSKPNIVYIFADDMGYGDLSCNNENSKINTVNLDIMAEQGVRFTDAHSSSAVCTPSRYSVLTGRYNWRSRLKSGVLMGHSKHLIEPGRMTVASLLKKHGYATGCIGKWHLGWDWQKDENGKVDYSKPIGRAPITNGFDYFYGISASLDMPPYVYVENDRVTELPTEHYRGTSDKKAFARGGPIAPSFKHENVLPEITKKAVEFIDEHKSEPFFLYFPLPAPHTPILPTREFQGKSNTNEYGDFCLQVDDTVGRVVAALKANGLEDNTIVIFSADNGCSPQADFDELKSFGHNPSYVFRGHKADIYEGGHRVPLVMQWLGGTKGGRVVDDTVCLVDLLATAAEIVGEELPFDAGEDSVSNLPLWRGSGGVEPIREAIVHHSINGNYSIRRGDWKLEFCPGSGGWSYPRAGQEPKGSPSIQLYNLKTDIGERKNIQAENPEIVAELTALMLKYVKTGRSTPGPDSDNNGTLPWRGLDWADRNELINPDDIFWHWRITHPYPYDKTKTIAEQVHVPETSEMPENCVVFGALPEEVVNFNKLLGNGENVCTYAQTNLISPKATTCRLGFNSDDGIMVWLNGEKIHEMDVHRGVGHATEYVDATLKEGANTLLVKITQGGGGWAMRVVVESADELKSMVIEK